MRRRIVAAILALVVLPVAIGPSSASGLQLTSPAASISSVSGGFVHHESRHWTWDAPKGWRALAKSRKNLSLFGPAVPGGLTARAERAASNLKCESGSTWDRRVARYFRKYRQDLRDRGWTIAHASEIFHPKNAPADLRRQRLQLGRGYGIEVADYNLVGEVAGVLTCHGLTRYRDNNIDKYTRAGVARVKRVLESIRRK